MVGSVGEELEFLYDIEFGEFGDADALNVVHCGKFVARIASMKGPVIVAPAGRVVVGKKW